MSCTYDEEQYARLIVWFTWPFDVLRILTGKKHRQNSSAYKKYKYGHLGRWYIKSTLYNRENLKQNLQKNELVIGKTPFFMTDPFYTPHSICLNIGSFDMVVLYENHTFSILVLSTKKWYFSFLEKAFVFQKICFKVKI